MTTTNLLLQINERVEALSPDQLIAPDHRLPKNRDKVVGALSDHQRRLYTLIGLVSNEHNEMNSESKELASKIADAAGNVQALPALLNLLRSGLDPAVVEKLQELQIKMRLKQREQKLIQDLFWMDVISSFDALKDKEIIEIYDDWSVGWNHPRRGGVMGLEMEDIPPGLRKMFENAFGEELEDA